MIDTILLATDGSPAAERAADMAASLSTRYGARVITVHAFDPVPRYLGEPNYGNALHQALERAEELMVQVAERLREAGVADLKTEVVEGPAANAILDMAETREPDLIVLGARGMSPWQGVILGSVSLAVTQRARFPVLVVK